MSECGANACGETCQTNGKAGGQAPIDLAEVDAIVAGIGRRPEDLIPLLQAIQKRYGRSARGMLAVLSFFVFIAWTQAELFMGGQLMSPFLNVPPWVCMAILVAPIILYVYMGGFRANVATDVAQFLIMKRERGWNVALGIGLFVSTFAFGSGWLLNRFLLFTSIL